MLIRRIAAALVLCLLATLAGAQETYPLRPVRLIVPTNAGGVPDTLARLLAQKLAAHFSRPFIVENRPGAANLVGSDYVAKSVPDGYTLLIGTAQVFGILPSLQPKMPFDVVKDFTPIMRMTNTSLLIVVGADLPVNNIPEFVKYVASRPNQVSYGSSGIGSGHHLVMEAFAARAGGLKMTHVAFKGSQDGLRAVLGGQLQATVIAVTSVLPQIRAGKVKALGISTMSRSKLVPDVAPIAEQGYPGFNLSNYTGLFAPAGTPRSIVLQLEAATAKAMNDAEVVRSLENIGFDMAVLNSEAYAKAILNDLDEYGKAVKAAGVKLE
jgi:tripartite-type tricarboxylate transporter receptor subunit TctC